MHKSKLKQLRLAVFLACFPLAASAAGLGKLTVNSGLGEPLNADIELVSTTPEELASLAANIAPEEAYAAQGIERAGIYNSIRVEVVKKPSGSFLHLSSNQPVSDPFLDMLIQVDWSTGRLVREYTVLLDPPGYSADQASSSVVAPEVVSPPKSNVESSNTAASEPASLPINNIASESKSAVSTTPSKDADAAAKLEKAKEEYKTEKGDTLSKIARDLNVENVSLDQMLVGLYKANKEAFVKENMNNLKVGQIIKVPTASELQAISKQQATKEVRMQAADWNAYRNTLAGVVENTAKAQVEAPTKSADTEKPSKEEFHSATKGKITAPAVDKAAPIEAAPKDVIKLSKSEDTKKKQATTDSAQAMKDKLNALQEEGLAREKSVKEASERVSSLEKQVDDLQKLLTLKNKSLADMQKNAEALKTAPQPASVVEPPKPEATKPEAEVVKPTEPAPQQTEIPKAETPKPAETVKPNKPPKPAPVEQAPVAAPSMMDEILLGLDPVVIGGGAGALALIAGGWVWMRNKRKRNLDNFEKGILTAGGLKANTVFGNTAGGTVDTGDTSFLTDFSQSVNGMIDTHDVDPIAEAEVYMAYGREAQAEEILNDAISKDPKRYELHLKLLEIYANRNDTSAFEAISGELYSTLGATDPVWAKVAALGHKMEPDNPLYDISSVATSTMAFDATSAGMAAVISDKTSPSRSSSIEKLDAGDFDTAELMTESSLDFSLGGDDDVEDNIVQSEEATLGFDLSESSNAMEFDLSDSIGRSDGKSDVSTAKEVDESADFVMDFSETEVAVPAAENVLEFNETMPKMESQEESLDLSMPDLDLPKAAPIEDEEAPSFESAMSFDIPETPLNDVTEVIAETLDAPNDLDFNFDIGAESEIDTSSSSLPSFDIPELSEKKLVEEKSPAAAPEIDLSGISLDLDDLPNMTSEAPEIEEITMSSNGESEDVNTKLELVTAYIDMGDTEGARELLEEVVKEGGPSQRERAEKLLSGLV